MRAVKSAATERASMSRPTEHRSYSTSGSPCSFTPGTIRSRRGFMRSIAAAALIVVACLALPARSAAQALGTVAGVVKDTSGAVLPGVTVEVASPALIEKVRNVATDGVGQYRVVNLPPGTYSVTFTLTGFSTVKRDGIEVTANFTASVN